jgi:hypothetical protein
LTRSRRSQPRVVSHGVDQRESPDLEALRDERALGHRPVDIVAGNRDGLATAEGRVEAYQPGGELGDRRRLEGQLALRATTPRQVDGDRPQAGGGEVFDDGQPDAAPVRPVQQQDHGPIAGRQIAGGPAVDVHRRSPHRRRVHADHSLSRTPQEQYCYKVTQSNIMFVMSYINCFPYAAYGRGATG